jgi:predicted dehydrogenase
VPAGRWPAFMAALRDALHGQAPPPVSALQALAVQRLIDLGVESDEAGRTCAVPV